MEHASRTLSFGAPCALMFLPVRIYVHMFKISHNALDYWYLIANEIIAKGRRRKKRIILKLGIEWVEEGVHLKYCYCQLPREYNFYIKLPWRSKVLISTLF